MRERDAPGTNIEVETPRLQLPPQIALNIRDWGTAKWRPWSRSYFAPIFLGFLVDVPHALFAGLTMGQDVAGNGVCLVCPRGQDVFLSEARRYAERRC